MKLKMLPWISVNNINISHLSSLIATGTHKMSRVFIHHITDGVWGPRSQAAFCSPRQQWQSCGQNSRLLILCAPLSPQHVQPLTWPPLMPLPRKGHFAFVSRQSSCLREAHFSEIFFRFTDFLNLNIPEQGMDSFIKKIISPWLLHFDMLFKICTK